MLPHTSLGPYDLGRLLGEGGMGAVYEATHVDLRKRVAIKILRSDDPDARDRFRREGLASARIRHPNVVDVFDVGADPDGAPYLVMEYLSGESLGAAIDRGGAMTPRAFVDLFLPVLAGVTAAHEAGVVHRDIKPDNIFLARDGAGRIVPKVLDFGIAKLTGDARITATAGTLGTPQYMSPEQAIAGARADARSDQYSLGAVAYEALTGVVPFVEAGAEIYPLLKAIVEGPLTPPSSICIGMPPALEAAVLRAMARDPTDRYPDVRSFGRALLPFASPRCRAAWGAWAADDNEPTGVVHTGAHHRARAIGQDTISDSASEIQARPARAARTGVLHNAWVRRSVAVALVAAAGLAAANHREPPAEQRTSVTETHAQDTHVPDPPNAPEISPVPAVDASVLVASPVEARVAVRPPNAATRPRERPRPMAHHARERGRMALGANGAPLVE